FGDARGLDLGRPPRHARKTKPVRVEQRNSNIAKAISLSRRVFHYAIHGLHHRPVGDRQHLSAVSVIISVGPAVRSVGATATVPNNQIGRTPLVRYAEMV